MNRIVHSIDAFQEWFGRLGALLILPMVGVVVYEVFMRYILDAPTSWGFETTSFIYGVHYMLGLGYAHLHDNHVSIDIFESRLPDRGRAVLRILTAVVIFFPTIGGLTFFGWRYAIDSWRSLEHLSTSWAPPVYPFKTVMAVGFSLLLIQGFSRFIRDLGIAANREGAAQ
ncbi:MAG: TRAP transporter small permease subunit [Deltaproteobacteria bacterium]|nr:TRAP transporter small permease subunit [Candidatus Anaeroferrophillacea bacterium]